MKKLLIYSFYGNKSPVLKVNKILTEPALVWAIVLLVVPQFSSLEFSGITGNLQESVRSAQAEQLAAE